MAAKFDISKWLKLSLKWLVSIAGLAYVFSKIDFALMLDLLVQVRFWSLVLAFVFFNVSKFFSAIRQARIFRCIGIDLSFTQHLRLYYIGMFYNLLLPGGIGGDGYKIILLRQSHATSWKTLISTNIIDRITGLAMLLGMLLALVPFSSLSAYSFQFAWLFLVGLFVYWLVFNMAFKVYLSAFFTLHVQSILVQICQLIAVYFILLSLPGQLVHTDYFMLFLVSSVAAVVPLTVGGLGARELVSLQLAPLLSIDLQTAVSIGLLFFLITLFSSLVGLLLKPNLSASEQKSKSSA